MEKRESLGDVSNNVDSINEVQRYLQCESDGRSRLSPLCSVLLCRGCSVLSAPTQQVIIGLKCHLHG